MIFHPNSNILIQNSAFENVTHLFMLKRECNENENLEMLKDHIESDAMTAINGFNKNQATANADIFQSILLSRGSTGDFMVNVGGYSIPPNKTLKCWELPLMIN